MAIQSIGGRRSDLNTIQVHYIPPPKGSNPFAAYAAEYMNIVTPLALETHRRRIAAMDPQQQKENYLRELQIRLQADSRQRARQTTKSNVPDLLKSRDTVNGQIITLANKRDDLLADTYAALRETKALVMPQKLRRELGNQLTLSAEALKASANPQDVSRWLTEVNNLLGEIENLSGMNDDYLAQIYPEVNNAIKNVLSQTALSDSMQKSLAGLAQAQLVGWAGTKLKTVNVPAFEETKKELVTLREQRTLYNKALSRDPLGQQFVTQDDSAESAPASAAKTDAPFQLDQPARTYSDVFSAQAASLPSSQTVPTTDSSAAKLSDMYTDNVRASLGRPGAPIPGFEKRDPTMSRAKAFARTADDDQFQTFQSEIDRRELARQRRGRELRPVDYRRAMNVASRAVDNVPVEQDVAALQPGLHSKTGKPIESPQNQFEDSLVPAGSTLAKDIAELMVGAINPAEEAALDVTDPLRAEEARREPFLETNIEAEPNQYGQDPQTDIYGPDDLQQYPTSDVPLSQTAPPASDNIMRRVNAAEPGSTVASATADFARRAVAANQQQLPSDDAVEYYIQRSNVLENEEPTPENQQATAELSSDPSVQQLAQKAASEVPAANRATALNNAMLIATSFKEAGFSNNAIAAALANALKESSLDHMVQHGRPAWDSSRYNEKVKPNTENSAGLFQLNSAPAAAGAGMSLKQRTDPQQNIDRILQVINGPVGRKFRRLDKEGASIEELTNVFTKDIENPAYEDQDGNYFDKGANRAAYASKLFGAPASSNSAVSPVQANVAMPQMTLVPAIGNALEQLFGVYEPPASALEPVGFYSKPPQNTEPNRSILASDDPYIGTRRNASESMNPSLMEQLPSMADDVTLDNLFGPMGRQVLDALPGNVPDRLLNARDAFTGSLSAPVGNPSSVPPIIPGTMPAFAPPMAELLQQLFEPEQPDEVSPLPVEPASTSTLDILEAAEANEAINFAQPDVMQLQSSQLPIVYPYGVPPDMMNRIGLPRAEVEEYNRVLQFGPVISNSVNSPGAVAFEQRYPTVRGLSPAARGAAMRRAQLLEKQGAAPEDIAIVIQREFGGM